MKNKPLVSVIMGIYNCQNTLRESIDSIINQTYTNWQLIMCDDNSNDRTYEIARSYANKFKDKIILIKNKENIGLAGSLNNCLEHVKGYYVARQDGDDISVKDRFEKQVDFLQKNSQYDLVGTSMISFNEKGINGVRGLLNDEPDKGKIAVLPPFCHATIMVKFTVYKELNGYKVTKYTKRCEDIDLWFRFFHKGYRGFNMQEALYMVRDDDNSYKRRNLKSYLYATKVCFDGYRLLKLPLKKYIYLSKPLIAAIIPISLKKYYHSRLNNA